MPVSRFSCFPSSVGMQMWSLVLEPPCSALKVAENESVLSPPYRPSFKMWLMYTALSQVPGYKPSYSMCHGFWQFKWDHLLSLCFFVTKRLQAKLQYPSCFVTAALQGQPGNHSSYGGQSTRLKDKVASSIDSFLPIHQPPSRPSCFWSGYPSMEIQRRGGKRRTIDASGSKGNTPGWKY